MTSSAPDSANGSREIVLKHAPARRRRSRLEDRPHARSGRMTTAHGPQRLEDRGRMVREVVVDRDAAGRAAQFQPAAHAAEIRQSAAHLFGRQPDGATRPRSPPGRSSRCARRTAEQYVFFFYCGYTFSYVLLLARYRARQMMPTKLQLMRSSRNLFARRHAALMLVLGTHPSSHDEVCDIMRVALDELTKDLLHDGPVPRAVVNALDELPASPRRRRRAVSSSRKGCHRVARDLVPSEPLRRSRYGHREVGQPCRSACLPREWF